MKYRRLGNTSLMVSEISFGTIPVLQGNVPVLPEYYNLSDKEAIDVMHYAFQKGCNLFDTAIVPEYGDAEIKLGKFAQFIGRENIIISDKSRFFSGNEMYTAVLKSIDNLKTNPDIYFVHQVDEGNVDTVFDKSGAIEALTELKAEGKIRFTGVATHYYDILYRGALDKRVDVLQGSGNMLERGMLDRIEKESCFNEKGLIINKVFAAGILPKFFDENTLISNVLSYPISTALIGLGTFNQIDISMDNIFEYKRTAFSDVIIHLERHFNTIPCTRCQSCKCINGTEISRIFRQFNYFFLGKEYWALRKLDLEIEKRANDCIKCTNMICNCIDNIDIPCMIRMVSEFVKIHIRNSYI